MKNIILTFLTAAAFVLLMSAGENYESELTNATTNTVNFRLDTITNSEIDTLELSATYLSNYEGSVGAVITNISGTSSLTIVVDEGFTHGNATRWKLGQDTITTTSAATTALVDFGRLAGTKYRIRVIGAGTQSTSYRISFIAKGK